MEAANRQGYTEAFKRHVVWEVESGRISKSEASRKYGILGHSTILKWCRKYGRKSQIHTGKEQRVVMTDPDRELLYLRNENKALKEKLEDAWDKNLIWETLVDVAERELQIPIRKKYGAKLSGK